MLIMLRVLNGTTRLAQIARLARGSRQMPKSPRYPKMGRSSPPTCLPEWRRKKHEGRRRVEIRNRVFPVPERAMRKPTPMPFAFMAPAVMAGLRPLLVGALAVLVWRKLNCERRAGSYILTRQEGAGLSKKESRISPALGTPRRGPSVPVPAESGAMLNLLRRPFSGLHMRECPNRATATLCTVLRYAHCILIRQGRPRSLPCRCFTPSGRAACLWTIRCAAQRSRIDMEPFRSVTSDRAALYALRAPP